MFNNCLCGTLSKALQKSKKIRSTCFFHHLPAVSDHQGEKDYEPRKHRRDGYLAAVSREDLDYNAVDKYQICSRHFKSGKPASLYNTTHPGWLPKLHMGHNSVKPADTERYERLQKRNSMQDLWDQIPTVLDAEIEAFLLCEVEAIIVKQINKAKQCFKPSALSSELDTMRKELATAQQTVELLKAELALKGLPPFTDQDFTSDEFTHFYTGLPNIGMLKATFEHAHKTLLVEWNTTLAPFQEFVCTLIKLSINPPIQDLGYQFGVSTSTVSRILLKWLGQMDIRMRDLIHWPDREALQKTMPVCFQESFGKKVAIIIDCFEIFIERPSNLEARATTWSNYKHKNTAKVLLGSHHKV